MQDSPFDPQNVPGSVCQILERLDSQGFETWLVGGCVRDLCLGLEPKDFDLATSALPEQVLQLFPHHFATGLEHGTVTVIWDHEAVEVTTFRSDGSYSDSRRPDLVIFHDQIEADLARRDFTMNSMAFRPDRGLLDPNGGLADLRQGVLCSVGDPEARFAEDALRMLRAVRFAVTYNLVPDAPLVRAAGRMSSRLDRLSRERVAAELLTILGSPYSGHLRDFSGCGLLAVATELLLQVRAEDQDLCARLGTLISPGLSMDQRLPLLYLAASAATLDNESLRAIMKPLFRSAAGHRLQHLLMHESRVSRHLAQAGEAMLYLMYLRLLLPAGDPLRRADRYRLLRLLARRCHLDEQGALRTAAAAASLLRLFLTASQPGINPDLLPGEYTGPADCPLTLAGLALNGRQLQLAGWKSGPALRVLLDRLLSRVIAAPELNRPADLLALARDITAGQRLPLAGVRK